MRAILLGLGVLLLGQPVHSVADQEDFKVLYDVTFNLTCEGPDFNISALPPSEQPVHYFWITPSGDYLGTSPDVHSENMRAMTRNNVLIIKKMDDPDFGIYNCMIETSSKIYKLAVRKGINVDGPYYGDLLLKYRMNIIIGVCSGGGLLVICILGCLIYHLRYRNDDDNESDEVQLNGKINDVHGYDNTVMDEEKASTSSDQYAQVEASEKRPISEAETDTRL